VLCYTASRSTTDTLNVLARTHTRVAERRKSWAVVMAEVGELGLQVRTAAASPRSLHIRHLSIASAIAIAIAIAIASSAEISLRDAIDAPALQ
jgi:hypothetical protein